MKEQRPSDDIVTIDNERYLVPCRFKDGEFVRSLEHKIKLPIEITNGFHINIDRTNKYIPPVTVIDRILHLFSKKN